MMEGPLPSKHDLGLHRRLPTSEVESVKVPMESLLGFLSTREFHPCLRDAVIAREAFYQCPRPLVRNHLLFFAGDRERRSKVAAIW